MRKLSTLAIVCWGTVAMLAFSGASFAEEVTANAANGKKIYEEGKGDVVLACKTCHGDKAMGMDTMGSPRLANIGYTYIVKQLTDYAEDKRIDQTAQAMNGIAKGLSAQDKRDLASYENTGFPREGELSDLKAIKADGKVVGDTSSGQALVRYGDKGRVSACGSCHGFNGRGAAPVYPKLSQQKYVYLVNQLTHWRDASRANDPVQNGVGQMRAIAKSLTDADINNAAAFLSQAPDSTPGNGMEIDNQSDMKNIKVVR